MIQLHNKGAMPAPSSSSPSLLFKFLAILLKVILLSMRTSSRPDSKQQRLINHPFFIDTPENGPFIPLTWNREIQKGNKRFPQIQRNVGNALVKYILMTKVPRP